MVSDKWIGFFQATSKTLRELRVFLSDLGVEIKVNNHPARFHAVFGLIFNDRLNMNEALRVANWKDRLLYRLGKRGAFLVEGDSMAPTLMHGDVVFTQPSAVYAVGDIVLAEHPYKSSVKILKRIALIDPNGSAELIGDNPDQSTDSRTFGAVSIESIIGTVVCRLK